MYYLFHVKLCKCKLFNSDLTNQYGMPFQLNKPYKTEGEVSFGTKGNGFHFAKRLEDTLRYGDMDNLNVNQVIGLVEGSGEIITREDDYYGYYDLYSASQIEILKILSREEVIEEAKKMYPERLARFIQGYKLTEEEIEFFKNKFLSNYQVNFHLEYYQKKELAKVKSKR